MRKTTVAEPATARAVIRCGIYTRKSTEEGLQQEFNSLDAQREAAEAYIKSQAAEGWTCHPENYDDGGFTGGNMDRPALRRLLADIQASKIDCVVVHRVDRLSRSLLDFAKMMQTFDAYHVSFVSVTQQINSATSMGRLMLNVLLSFAQFEREIIGERTRDKIAATRRKGKWAGGTPLLGYDVDPRTTRLLVNEDEAVRVRAIFALYLEYQALLPVVQELQRRGWTTKRWVNQAGRQRGGRPFDRTNLHRLLTKIAYIGKVRYKNEIHPGEQPALVETATWEKVQTLLEGKGRSGSGPGRGTNGFLLKGLLRCTACNSAMTPSHTKRGCRRYRYYVCTNAQKRGWDQCPSKSIPAGQIETFVVEQICSIGSDPSLLAQARQRDETRPTEPAEECSADEVRAALASFNSVWSTLPPQEQARIVDLLVERVDYDGGKETVSISFQPTGLEQLVDELAAQMKEKSA